MATELANFITDLEKLGFYDVALPFILIFTLFFAILQKIKIFGENSKNFNAVIALVMAFLVVRTDTIVTIMNEFLPQVSLIALVFIVILILIGILLGPAPGGWGGIPLGLGLIITFVGVGWALFSSTRASLPDWLRFSASDRNLYIGLFLFFLFIYYITSEPKEGSTWKDILAGLGDLPSQLGKGGKH